MHLDYLLQEGTKGYIHITSDKESQYVQIYLLSCGYCWTDMGRLRLPVDEFFIYIPHGNRQLSYSISPIDVSFEYKDVTQEVYQLAGLLPTPYEFW